MPEGDTIYRIADVMRRALGDEPITSASGRPGGAQLERVVGSHVVAVRSRGKHLLISFDDDLTLHTHLQMSGTWHRYRPHDPWRLPPQEAVAVLETRRVVAVCFGAPTVELIETRALPLHPVLSALGPDLLDPDCDVEQVVVRLGASGQPLALALLDQRIVAGIGNVYRCEVLALERVSPFVIAADVPAGTLRRVLLRTRSLLRDNLEGEARATVPGAPRGERVVYRRAGRPCGRCGTLVRSRPLGSPPRRVYWCRECQRQA